MPTRDQVVRPAARGRPGEGGDCLGAEALGSSAAIGGAVGGDGC